MHMANIREKKKISSNRMPTTLEVTNGRKMPNNRGYMLCKTYVDAICRPNDIECTRIIEDFENRQRGSRSGSLSRPVTRL